MPRTRAKYVDSRVQYGKGRAASVLAHYSQRVRIHDLQHPEHFSNRDHSVVVRGDVKSTSSCAE